MDAVCLGTSIRQGAKDVTVLQIMPQEPTSRPDNQPWPTFDRQLVHERRGVRVQEPDRDEHQVGGQHALCHVAGRRVRMW